MLLSKVVDENRTDVLRKYGIDRTHFSTPGEQQAYDFVQSYAEANGQAPSYAAVAGAVPAFDEAYMPDVSDSYEWLAGQVKDHAGKADIASLIDGDIAKNFDKKSAIDTIDRLQSELERIRMGTTVRQKVGTAVKADTEKFLEEYEARKEGRSFTVWQSRFPTVNAEVGGYMSGNMYCWFGRTGRGKSVIVLEEAIEAAMQGATVLFWSLEMAWFEVMVRAYVSISARHGVSTANIDGMDFEAGFDAKALRTGQLSEDFEAGFRTFLSCMSEYLPGELVFRSTDEAGFSERNLRKLEADIEELGADVAVVDPFYYLDYEKNTSKKTGGDAENTSMKLRKITGRLNIVTHAVTQADEDDKEMSEDGVRELKAPKRSEVKKTAQLPEDSTNLFAIDTNDGLGVVSVGKGRNGGEGVEAELFYHPNVGVVKEIDAQELAISQF
ncbi:DNA helicase [Salibacterium lacus]|uniref:DNA helicase n=1 Tax=Salibacterium lacus TaxID=1898109 RepID=A0ABW5T1D4_9BACI